MTVLELTRYSVPKIIPEMEHQPFSSDMALNDFWLFPKIKSALGGRRFQDIEDIQQNVMTALKAVQHQGSKKCYHHWAKCIPAQGDYFEGDLSQ